ncbi:L-xylulose reductase [Folsomia candida]|uniref:L-xylulose reductase n=1 Tax=Folsomia candida TaxID=158441 RepID=UPI000B8F72E5|nr:L-xylulose reductase [Folsomia candida]
MDISFSGKRILVTGGGRGIGREICLTLAKCPQVTVFALSQGKTHLDSLKALAPSVNIVPVDLADHEATRKAVAAILPIHALVNNAGVAHLASFLDMEMDAFDKVFEVNVKAVFNVSQVVAKCMVEQKIAGSIVNVSSQASQAALQDHAAYCASKGAVDMLSKVMALELGPHNIRVNCVNPTVVLTEMGRLGWSDPVKAGPMLAKIPLGRFAEVSEVVNAVLFLLSDKASMINGITLPIDGGFLAT